ncbi:hypothetical protein BUE80_DR002870 [Diplocarpon rosae]|nr:hypothetical protein BUE80_DR002870 [Diplocarpon rosae]
MASSTCRTLANSRSQQTDQNLILKSTPPDPMPAQTPTQACPLLELPPELLHQVATDHYAALPPFTLTKENLHLPLHALTALSRSSPLFACLPRSLYYQHATFTFTYPGLATTFAGLGAGKEGVRRARVLYGEVGGSCEGLGFEGSGCGGEKADWVYTLLKEFEALEEVTFVVEGFGDRHGDEDVDLGGDRMGTWWSCVRDAVREGLAGRSLKRGENGFVLRVEGVNGGSIRERIGGDGS